MKNAYGTLTGDGSGEGSGVGLSVGAGVGICQLYNKLRTKYVNKINSSMK
jgi:hypothetical protein